jgi:hypothetical protein
MKSSEIAVEAMTALKKFRQLVLSVDSMDENSKKFIEMHIEFLSAEVLGNIYKYEYIDLWYEHSQKKSKKNFINNPKKTLEFLESLRPQDSKKSSERK